MEKATGAELFRKWWLAESPPGTFDQAQCRVAFLAGFAYGTSARTEAQRAAPFDGAQDALRFILDVWESVVVRGDVYVLVRLDREQCREAGEVVGEMINQSESRKDVNTR